MAKGGKGPSVVVTAPPEKTNQPQKSPLKAWGDPSTTQDTKRVEETNQLRSTPLTADPDKHAHFPHDLITRGSINEKTNIGELTLPEYLWGFIQIIKSKEGDNEDVPHMNLHLEKIMQDAKTYDWSCVRAWSEDIFTRVSKGTLKWSDTYQIDKLQTQTSHAREIQPQTNSTMGQKITEVYEMSEELWKAQPGPPCKSFQTDSCKYSTDHVQNGYRHLHVCIYCLANKCLLQPHSLKGCEARQLDNQGKSNFGSEN